MEKESVAIGIDLGKTYLCVEIWKDNQGARTKNILFN